MEADQLLHAFVQDTELLEFALSLLSDSVKAELCIGVSMKLLSRFERTGSMYDLNRAITLNEQAVTFTPKDHPNLYARLSNLGDSLQSRYQQTGSMDDLNRAINNYEQAFASTPEDNPDRAALCNTLGSALQARYQRTGLMDDLNRAITTYEQVLPVTPEDHPHRAALYSALGSALQARFERSGSVDDLDRAIKTNIHAVASTPNEHPDLAIYLSNLGNALQTRFERMGSMDDLDQAITTIQQAVASTQNDQLSLAGRLNNLGNALQARFERTGSMDSLDLAIKTNAQAVASSPDNNPDRAIYLNNLGNALQRRFERTGSMDDLDRAITANEQAVASTSDDHPDRAIYLNNLGNALQSRFERRGSMDDLDRAIATNEQAVLSTPEDHPDRAIYLSNLGNALHKRFERTGSMDDLDRAITANEQAVASTPDDHPDRAIYLSNLGNALQSRFDRTRSMDDLDREIRLTEQAVRSTPDYSPDYAGMLSNLGIALQSRFKRTGSLDDLNESVTTYEQAVTFTLKDHPSLAGRLNNLGNALQSRYEQTGALKDLDRAIAMKEQAVASTPNDHPDRAIYLDNLGSALQRRSERTGSIADLDRAIQAKEQAVKTETAPPFIRLKAASSCSDLLIGRRAYSRAKPILYAAVRLLSTLSPRALKLSDQQFNISQFANITSRAVSLSIADSEDPYVSLQLLELGRGILANLQLEIRSDISVLAASHPNLAQRFQDLRERVDTHSIIADSSFTFDSHRTMDLSVSVNERRSLLKEFDDLLRSIRSLHGFENFLAGPSKSELHRLAEGGPIVVFNISDIRSDAFLITHYNICSIQLPLLTSNSLMDSAKRFMTAIHDQYNLKNYNNARKEMKAILEWLWDVAVNPVLSGLGFTQLPPPDAAWPRVWWVGSGPLNILPIHASGYHDSTPPQTALDRVISSYAPTVKSLAYARERRTIVDKLALKEKAILVAMSTTPERSPLPYVQMEVEDIKKLYSDASIDITVLQNPTRRQVLSELPNYTIAHFACYGYSAADPSQSSLLLEDWKNGSLTVSDLASLNIQYAKLAYLSAGHTSVIRDFSLMDESITLSSAVQLSGYPSVVGTLWQIMDSTSAKVARDVHAWILKGNNGLDVHRTAEGLHKAVRDLRDRTRLIRGSVIISDPLVWAPYIHVGI